MWLVLVWPAFIQPSRQPSPLIGVSSACRLADLVGWNSLCASPTRSILDILWCRHLLSVFFPYFTLQPFPVYFAPEQTMTPWFLMSAGFYTFLDQCLFQYNTTAFLPTSLWIHSTTRTFSRILLLNTAILHDLAEREDRKTKHWLMLKQRDAY